METKTIKCSLGTLEIRGLTAGEAMRSADMQKSIDRLYSKDIEKHADEIEKMTLSMLAHCIVSVDDGPANEKELVEKLRKGTVVEIGELNEAITNTTSLPKDLKKNL